MNYYFSILVLLTVYLYIQLKKILDRSFKKVKDNFAKAQDEYERLLSENIRLKEENSSLAKTAEETITLYDITKQICKSLDENKVFTNFCEQINTYLKIGDCKFLKVPLDLSQYDGYSVVSLNIEKEPIGYLAAAQVKEEEKEKFHILAQQFLLGIKRSILYQRVQELAITDSLTGVFSRRFLLERFQEEIERSKKFKFSFAFLMVDVDNFKECNDHYGHLVGDAILRWVSQTVKENIRQIDLVGRYGGEEFFIILTETGKKEARFAAERIRQAVADKAIKVYDEELHITVSIGVAIFPEDGSVEQELIEKADEALYQAKSSGRNRVCVYGN